MKFDVHVSRHAFETMLLASVEAFALGHHPMTPRKAGSRAVEVIGPIWGWVKRQTHTTTLKIERAAVSLAAERTYEGCAMPTETQRLLSSTMSVLAPDAVLLGDFHSHPWKGGIEEVRQEDGFEFTADDLEVFLEDDPIWASSGGNPTILVIAVCRLGRLANAPPRRLRPDLWTLDIGKYRCWIAACVGFGERNHTNAGDGQVNLHLDLTG